MICQVCKQVTKSIKGLACHLKKAHKMTSHAYYKEYLQQPGEGKCLNPTCVNETTFNNLIKGYLNHYGKQKYCTLSCAKSSEEVNNKQRATNLERYGNAGYRNVDGGKATCLEKYGATNPLAKNTAAYHKRNATVLAKYGVSNVFQSKGVIDQIRTTNEKSGYWTDFTNISYTDYREYYRLAWNYFKSIREAFMKTWDGYDYYDGTYIRKNLALDSNLSDYPTVDHKISIRECLLMGKTVQEASAFDNLCVTKKGLNSQKKCKSEEEFREWLLGKK